MERTVRIGNIDVNMKANANTPRLYRMEFNRDLIVDLQKFMNHVDDEGRIIGNFDFSVIENLAFIMQKQADGLNDIEAFLDQFEIDDVYEATAEIISLWTDSKKTTSTAKKKES